MSEPISTWRARNEIDRCAADLIQLFQYAQSDSDKRAIIDVVDKLMEACEKLSSVSIQKPLLANQ